MMSALSLLLLLALLQDPGAGENPPKDDAPKGSPPKSKIDFDLEEWRKKPAATTEKRDISIGEILDYVERHYAPGLGKDLSTAYGYIHLTSPLWDKWVDDYVDLILLAPRAGAHGGRIPTEIVEEEAKKLAEKEKERYVRQKKLTPGAAANILPSLTKRTLRLQGLSIEKEKLLERVVHLPAAKILRQHFVENDWRFSGAVKVSQILFSTKDPKTGKRYPHDIRQALGEKAVAVAKDLREGSDFTEQVKIYSDDTSTKEKAGDLGFLTRSTPLPEFFTRMAFQGIPGDIIGPFETELGFHIIKIMDRKAGRQPEFKTVRKAVEKDWLRQQKENLLRHLRAEAGLIIH